MGGRACLFFGTKAECLDRIIVGVAGVVDCVCDIIVINSDNPKISTGIVVYGGRNERTRVEFSSAMLRHRSRGFVPTQHY